MSTKVNPFVLCPRCSSALRSYWHLRSPRWLAANFPSWVKSLVASAPQMMRVSSSRQKSLSLLPTLLLELRENFEWWKILAYAVRSFFFCAARRRIHRFGRNYARCLSSLRIWGLDCQREHLVCVHLGVALYDSYEHSIGRFWFFAARNNPESAPLITWFNGGVSDADRPSILGCSLKSIRLAWSL